MKTALTIAGSDPTGGAGLQMDLRVFHHFGVHGLSAVSALTAQNTRGVTAILGTERLFFQKQLETLLADITPDALKTGMLYSVDAVHAVAETIKGYGLRNLVIDPVTLSSSGASLMEAGVLNAMKKELFPLAKAITPNIHEAAFLSGIKAGGKEDLEKIAVALKGLGPDTVIITGGHLDLLAELGDDTAETMELVYDGRTFHRISGKKIKGEYHGTGCAFSAAITALLALETPLIDSVQRAKEFVDKAIGNALSLGSGMKLLNV